MQTFPCDECGDWLEWKDMVHIAAPSGKPIHLCPPCDGEYREDELSQ
jgi:hypothetical protein